MTVVEGVSVELEWNTVHMWIDNVSTGLALSQKWS